MTLSFTGGLDRQCVIRAADTVSALIARPEVAEAWTRESACAGMSVGGLARHLAGQPINVVALLRADRSAGADAETIELLEHYARAAWVHEDLDSDANRSIRDAADEAASDGPTSTVLDLSRACDDLPSVLSDPPPTTYVPWQGWSLATDDFLVTRLMEMVVHSDDLASSVDVAPPQFGLRVLDPVVRLLGALASHRHGEAAIVRALSRPQRAPATISAF